MIIYLILALCVFGLVNSLFSLDVVSPLPFPLCPSQCNHQKQKKRQVNSYRNFSRNGIPMKGRVESSSLVTHFFLLQSPSPPINDEHTHKDTYTRPSCINRQINDTVKKV